MDYIDYILPVYFDKAEEPDIQGNGFFIDKLFITAAHILEKDAASIGIPYIYWKGVSVSAMQPFFLSLCLLPLLQHY